MEILDLLNITPETPLEILQMAGPEHPSAAQAHAGRGQPAIQRNLTGLMTRPEIPLRGLFRSAEQCSVIRHAYFPEASSWKSSSGSFRRSHTSCSYSPNAPFLAGHCHPSADGASKDWSSSPSGAPGRTLPRLWAGWARAHRLIDLEWLGIVGGALVAVVLTDFLGYWGHRLRHRLTPLWRLHQLHHSAERVDVARSFLRTHPLDHGLRCIDATLVVPSCSGSNGPAAWRWRGIWLLRGRFHATPTCERRAGSVLCCNAPKRAIHHEARRSRLQLWGSALWDLVFGTYRNPHLAPAETGFWDGASGRLGALLTGADMTNTESAHQELAA